MAEFRITSEGPRAFLVAGELDMAGAPAVDAAAAQSAGLRGPIMVDASDMTFADVVGIRAFLDWADALPSGCIILHGVSALVARIVGLMGDGRRNLHVLPHDVVAVA